MKLQKSYSLNIEENKKYIVTRKMTSYNILRIKIFVMTSIGLIIALSLISINPSRMSDYIRVYVLTIILFLVWTISMIIYKNYNNDVRSKVFLTKEIEKNKLLNTELAKANEGLKKLTLTDELTGIPNRRGFVSFIDSEYDQNLKKNSLLSIIMIDIDYFRQFNECLGHSGADKILIAIAKEINSVCVGSTDIASRYGGDEFILASINSDEKQISEIAEAIRNKVSKLKMPNSSLKNKRNISVSVGTSTVRVTTKEDIHRCIDLADKALYNAKEKGRNCVENLPDKQNSKFYEAS